MNEVLSVEEATRRYPRKADRMLKAMRHTFGPVYDQVAAESRDLVFQVSERAGVQYLHLTCTIEVTATTRADYLHPEERKASANSPHA